MAPLETVTVEAADARATVVLVHGAWHAAWCWQDGFSDRLADAGVSTVALSLRGHGGSPAERPLNRLRLRDYADDVVAVLDETTRGGRPVVVAGHSMGGGVVQHVLARADRPRLAGAALLASMPPRGVVGTTLRIARATPGTFLALNATRDLGRLVRTEDQVRSLFFRAETSDDVVARTSARVQSESYLAFLDMLVLDRPRPRRTDEPLLVLGARDDPIFPPEEVAATARAWRTAPEIVDGLGHDVMLDDGWERVADRLAAWVLSTTPPRQPD